ncbi:MAG TPA: hypothetical protein VHF26_25055 [Trebonia sp.]|nr:hypothetical protein [Trebonia sp.]
MPAQEVQLCGDDRLVLVEEGGVMRAVDLEDFALGGTAGGRARPVTRRSTVAPPRQQAGRPSAVSVRQA